MYNKTRMSAAVHNSMTENEVNSFIRLFKITPHFVSGARLIGIESMIAGGFIFVDSQGSVMDKVDPTLFRLAKANYGNEVVEFNQTFYKSFEKVAQMSLTKRLVDQITHYLTTYGAEAMGVRIPTYVPVQALDLPTTKGSKTKLVVIRVLPPAACVERLDNYLKTLTAPSPVIVELIRTILPMATVQTDDIKSFEIQVMKHKMDGTVPTNPVNLLRYLVYLTTGETLLIKNRYLRERIKGSAAQNGDLAYSILVKGDIVALSSIFLRYKPIFLAFKTHDKCAPLINHLRRLADKYHRPLSNESIQTFTMIDSAETRARVLSRATNRDLIKLLNSLYTKMAVSDLTPGVYNIRNGRVFVRENGVVPASNRDKQLADEVFIALKARLVPVLRGKRFYLPEYIQYAIPTTEKQMIGNIPYGSSIMADVDTAFTTGVHWYNSERQRVDIDLHLNGVTRHFGWNAEYHEGTNIIYTGDQTDAPKPYGAAEAYWFNPKDDAYVLSVNLFGGPDETEFKLFMTNTKPNAVSCRSSNYTYHPEEALFPAIPLKFDKGVRNMNIGLFVNDNFFFYGGTLSNNIVPTDNYEQYLQGMVAKLMAKCDMRTLLNECGATVLTSVDNLTEKELAKVISLAPEDIEVDTLFNIVDGNI